MAASESAYRAISSFAVFVDGMPRSIREGDFVAADDPLVAKHSPQRPLFQPVSEFITDATAPPPVIRPEQPVGERVETSRRRSRRNQPKENTMVHSLPPEDENSPASPFAPMQPSAGVVADDADEKGQNLAGGPKASEFTPSEDEVQVFAAPSTGHTGEADLSGAQAQDGTQAGQAAKAGGTAKAQEAQKAQDDAMAKEADKQASKSTEASKASDASKSSDKK